MTLSTKNWESKYLARTTVWIMIASLFCFMLGLHGEANIGLILILFLRLLASNRKTFLKDCLTNKFVWLFWSYWIISLLGLLYSNDVSNGARMLDTRWLMLLVPLSVLSLPADKNSYERILLGLLIAVCTAGVVSLIGSSINYFESGDTGYFYNDNLAGIVSKQGTYMGMIVNIALVVSIFFFFQKPKWRFWLVASGLFLILLQLLLAVRTALGVVFVLFFLMVLYMIFSQGRRTAVITIATFIVLSIASVFLFPQMFNRFKSMASSTEYRFDNPNGINHFNGEISSENWNGLTVRLALWECGWNVIKEHPVTGVGTGDYDGEMRKQYEANNFLYAMEMGFGVHNQYLYSWIAFGIGGLLLLLFMMIYPSVLSWKIGNYLYPACILVFALSMLTENIFSRYMGVYLFSVMNSLIFFLPRRMR